MIQLQGDLDNNSSLPLYIQVKNLLQSAIFDTADSIGKMLPTEMEIASHYGISRITARQAVLDLVAEGICFRIKGKGSFVADNRIRQDFANQILSYNDEMKSKGMKPETKVLDLSVRKCSENIARELGLRTGAEVIFMRRLRSADGQPVVIVDTWLPKQLCGDVLDHDMEKESLYHILSRSEETKVVRVVRTIEASLAGPKDAPLLDVKESDPVQIFRFTAYSAMRKPVEYSLSRYRADKSSFSIEINL